MALALYRKYRPRTFAEVVGQEHVTEPLSQALRSGRLHHAYLFSGPRGCGKTSSARILARSLNCEQGPTPEPCGVCASCRSLANDGTGSIDVIEIDAASHGGVDDARDLREKAFFAPVSSRYKIYVIDEAHMVSPAGFNALLKLVEEPPDYVKFIFATTEPEKVLGTIKSRTHHYPFRLIPPAVLRPYLQQLAEAEGIAVESAVFPLVVRAGGGSVRDALSVLDQLIAGAGPEGVTYARAVPLLGVTDVTLIDDMCDALAAGDGAAAYATIDRVAEAGHDPRRFASDLLERFRDLIVLQQVPDAVAKGLIDGPTDQLDAMSAQATRLGPATLSRCADIVHNGLVEMRGTTAPRLLLELITARMLLPGADDSAGAVLQRLERMERRLTLSGDTTDAVRPEPSPTAIGGSDGGGASSARAVAAAGRRSAADEKPETAGRAHPAPQARRPEPAGVLPDAPEETGTAPADTGVGHLTAASIREVWPEIITTVGRQSKKLAALASGATVRDLDGQTLVLTFRFPSHAKMVAADPDLITNGLYEALGGRWEIRCEVAGEAGAVPVASGGQTSRSAPARKKVPTASVEAVPTSAVPTSAVPTSAVPTSAVSATAAPTTAAPARPREAARQREADAPSASGGGDDDWPEPARPGGLAAAPAANQRHVDAPEPPVEEPSSGASPSGDTAPAGRIGAPPSDDARPDGAGEEPPYDPDYDGPVRAGTVAYEGFDPGDEPLDDVLDENTARQSSEQQAMQLLQDAFDAERIGET